MRKSGLPPRQDTGTQLPVDVKVNHLTMAHTLTRTMTVFVTHVSIKFVSTNSNQFGTTTKKITGKTQPAAARS